MNYTENYHLPQWEETDRIMRVDFNAAMANLEDGITEAQTTADALPYVVGTYTGDGAVQRTIHVGFRPRFVIICDDQKAVHPSTGGLLIAGPNQTSLRLYMKDTGFLMDSSEQEYSFPRINEKGRTYDYIAFR